MRGLRASFAFKGIRGSRVAVGREEEKIGLICSYFDTYPRRRPAVAIIVSGVVQAAQIGRQRSCELLSRAEMAPPTVRMHPVGVV